MATTVDSTTSSSSTSSAASSLASGAASSQELSDRFLKLLVAQMQNQDPLNPLDNAEVTSQMAQISTVTGLDNLNSTVSGLNTQFVQLQAMQGAALVGRDVAVEGDDLRVRDGVGDGGIELGAKADSVKVDILDSGGNLVGTVDLGAQEAGRISFTYDVPEAYQDAALTFKVTATSGTNAVDAMALSYQSIKAVSAFGDTLGIELDNGERVSYDAIWAFL